MTNSTGVGLIGTGGVATLHAEAINAVEGLHVAGAFSRNPENVRQFVEQHGGRAYASREELIQDDEVEVVSVCTLLDGHAPFALEGLRAHKHVIVEKPVGSTVEEIDSLQQEAERAGRFCVPCHNYVYAPALRRAKELLREGKFGRVANFWLIYNQRHDADGEPGTVGEPGTTLRHLCIHHAYALLYFLGRPTSVVAAASHMHFSDPDADDQVMLVLKMPDGAIANLWGSLVADDRTGAPWTVFYKLLGTEGGFAHTYDDVYCGEATLPGWDKPAYRDSFRYVYEHFASRCLAAGDAPLSTLADARDALCLINAAEQALAGATAIDYR